ncbi:hypothetical protein C8F01DRAFT_1250378 [Mycena amicta]|nr:hypothetical protein C8F01DRAFT_1250378 [Mycena amicta]
MVTPTLAPELWDQIIDELRTDRHTLRAVGLVCRAYVPRSRSHLFERFSCSRNWSLPSASLAECLSSPLCTILAAVQRLDLRYNVWTRDHPSIEVLAPHLLRLSNVRSLAISELCWPFLESSAAFASSVKELTLEGSYGHMQLAPSTMRRLTGCFPNLEHLIFVGASSLLEPYIPAHEIVVPKDGTNGAKLRHLSLRWCQCAILAGLLQPPAPPFGVHITHLTIDSLAPDDLQHICSYISHLDSLEFLSVGNMQIGVDERILPALLPGNIVSKLTTLRLKFIESGNAHNFFRFGTLCQWPSQSENRDGDGPAKQILLQVVACKANSESYRTTFVHGDLAPRNIIVRNAKIVAILDWELGGWYPEYWEYTTAWYANRSMLTFQELFLGEGFSQRYPEELIAEHCLSHLFIRFW